MTRSTFLLSLFSLLLFLGHSVLAQDVRSQSLTRLKALGFKPASSLPTETGRTALRPQEEIEARMDALHSLVLWVAVPQGTYDDAAMKKAALSGKYSQWLTAEEKAIFQLSKREAKAKHLDSIGWQMENIWALAWVLGYAEEPALAGQLQGDLARDLIFGFCEKGERKLRPLADVVAEEDLFYCAHNAVRSAQMGAETVPQGFDPAADGGGIHERRHALTWCLSPGVSWKDTDLST